MLNSGYSSPSAIQSQIRLSACLVQSESIRFFLTLQNEHSNGL